MISCDLREHEARSGIEKINKRLVESAGCTASPCPCEYPSSVVAASASSSLLGVLVCDLPSLTRRCRPPF